MPEIERIICRRLPIEFFDSDVPALCSWKAARSSDLCITQLNTSGKIGAGSRNARIVPGESVINGVRIRLRDRDHAERVRPEVLVRSKKEKFVFLDWSTESAAALLLAEVRLRVRRIRLIRVNEELV